MSDNNEEQEQEIPIEAAKSKESVQHQLEDLKTEEKVLNSWNKSSKDLIEQYKNKFDAFKAMADESGYIDQSNFQIGGEQKQELFHKIDTDGDGKISKEEWTQGWSKLDTQIQENQHKQTIAQQKMSIMDALDSKVEPGKRLDDPIVVSSYGGMLDKFRSASTLDDLSNIFNQPMSKPSPFRPKQQENEPQVLSQINFELKKPTFKKNENLLGQYKTPSKEGDFMIGESSSGRGSFINSFNNSKKPSGAKSPAQRFQGGYASPSVGFIQTSQYNYKEGNSISSKVQQSMNLQIDTKDVNRTNKRKEELQSFMGKIGLGKYDVPKATISLEQPNNNVFERLRQYVNGQAPPPASSRRNNNNNNNQPAGLGELVNDRQFNSSTFKQQVKAHRNDRSKSNGRDSANLADQSLKSFHLKMVHQQKQGSQAGLKFARV